MTSNSNTEQEGLSVSLQELLAKYDINDRDFIALVELTTAHTERAVAEATSYNDGRAYNVKELTDNTPQKERE